VRTSPFTCNRQSCVGLGSKGTPEGLERGMAKHRRSG